MEAGNMAAAGPPVRPWWRAEALATLVLAWPIVLTNLSQMAMALTETLLLGRLSAESQAGGLLGSSLYFAVIAPGFGLALAAAPLQAIARGEGRRAGGAGRGWVRTMRRATRSSLWACGIVCVPCCLLLWNTEPLLLLTGQEPVLAALAADYARAALWGVPGFCAFIVLRGFLGAMERPAAAMWISLAAVVLNAPLAWALIFPAGLGVQGAGVAASIADTALFIALVVVVLRDRRFRRLRIFGRFWRPDWGRLRQVFAVGLPIAAALIMEIGVFTAAALAMGWWGAVAVAAHAAAIQTASLTFMVPLGIGQAATARVGLAAGAGDGAAAARAGWVAVGLGAAFMAAMAGALVVAADVIASAFIDAADPQAAQVRALAATLLVVAGVFQLADGVQVVAAGALRGLADTRVPMLFAALGYWGLALPCGIALGWSAGLGPPGIWLGLALGLAVVAVLMLARWRRLSRAAGGLAVSRFRAG
jgi:MATE family multidrug resistance protein